MDKKKGLLNVALSILFVVVFPEKYRVVGVIVATIITNIFICHIIEPHVLYKYVFKINAKNYYLRNYIYIAIFSATLIAFHFAMISSDNQWVELFANGGISLAFSLVISAVVMVCDKDFRHYMKGFISRFIRRKKVEVDSVE